VEPVSSWLTYRRRLPRIVSTWRLVPGERPYPMAETSTSGCGVSAEAPVVSRTGPSSMVNVRVSSGVLHSRCIDKP
jgi:hypothetical protein